jgi:hypothetical protein
VDHEDVTTAILRPSDDDEYDVEAGHDSGGNQSQPQPQGALGGALGKVKRGVASGAARVKTGAAAGAAAVRERAPEYRERAARGAEAGREQARRTYATAHEAVTGTAPRERTEVERNESRLTRDLAETESLGLNPCQRVFCTCVGSGLAVLLAFVSISMAPRKAREGEEEDDPNWLWIGLYLVAWLIGIASTSIILSLDRQLRYMRNPIRGWAVGVWFVCLAAVIALGVTRNPTLGLVAVFFQACAYAWYVFSYMPFAKHCCKSIFR